MKSSKKYQYYKKIIKKSKLLKAPFFNALNLFTKLVSDMDLQGGPTGTLSGKDVFPVFIDRINKTRGREKVTSNEAYNLFYQKHSHELGHYFRVLYNLIKFVDKYEIEDKRFYTNLVRAQISDVEAVILYLNGLTGAGAKFKPLMEKYSLLKNVNQEHVLVTQATGSYEPNAF